jgi:hypothetical protein
MNKTDLLLTEDEIKKVENKAYTEWQYTKEFKDNFSNEFAFRTLRDKCLDKAKVERASLKTAKAIKEALYRVLMWQDFYQTLDELDSIIKEVEVK